MLKIKTCYRVLAVLLVLLAFLTGCGNTGDGTAETSGSENGTTGETTESTETTAPEPPNPNELFQLLNGAQYRVVRPDACGKITSDAAKTVRDAISITCGYDTELTDDWESPPPTRMRCWSGRRQGAFSRTRSRRSGFSII